MEFLHKKFLKNELSKWLEMGFITENNAEKIAKIYNIDLNIKDSSNFILKLIAYIFLALSFFTLIGANWEELPRILRLVIVIGVLAIVNFGGFFALKNGKERYATSLFFLGNFCYGAAIAMVAQIYHLGEHMPNGILLWATGAFILALAIQNGILVAQGLFLAILWYLMELEYGFADVGSNIILFFIFPSIFVLHKDSSRLLAFGLFVAIFVYIFSLQFKYYDSIESSYLIYILSYCLFMVSFGVWLQATGQSLIGEIFKKLSIVITFICITILLIVDLRFTEDYFLKNTFSFFNNYHGKIYLVFVITSAIVFFKLKQFMLFLLSISMLILPFILLHYGEYSKAIFSTIFVLIGSILIKKNLLFYGILAIFIVAFVRYMDLIGDYIGASILFMMFAVLVLILARKRRQK